MRLWCAVLISVVLCSGSTAGDNERAPKSMGCFGADSRKCQDTFLQYVIANCPKKPAGEEWRRKYCSFARN